MRQKSLRKQLSVALIASFTLLGVLGNLAVFQYVRHLDLAEFDEDLKEELQNIATLTVIEPNGEVELELHEFNLPQYRTSAENARYYQLWHRGGEPMVKSPSLGNDALPLQAVPPGRQIISDLTLPDGRKGRMISASGVATIQDGKKPIVALDPDTSKYVVRFALAKSREDVDGILKLELLFSLSIGALMTAGALFLTLRMTANAFSQVGSLSDSMGKIDLDTLSNRLPDAELPVELKPCAVQFNALLDRLQKGVEREKRFNVDVAHELRTPVTALLSIHELAVDECADGSLEDPGAYSKDALLLTQRLHRLIETLSSIHRAGSGREIVQVETIPLDRLIENTWLECEAIASARDIRLAFDGSGLEIDSDRIIAQAVFGNLFNNAVTYSPDGATVTCGVKREAASVLLEITNTTETDLDRDELRKLPQPFWQKDPARADPEHVGLGLALVFSYCKLLGWSTEYSMPEAGVFRASVSMKGA